MKEAANCGGLSLALRAIDPRHIPFAVPDLNGLPIYVLLCFLKGSVIVRRFNFMDADEMAVFTYEVNSVIHLGCPSRTEPITSSRSIDVRVSQERYRTQAQIKSALESSQYRLVERAFAPCGASARGYILRECLEPHLSIFAARDVGQPIKLCAFQSLI